MTTNDKQNFLYPRHPYRGSADLSQLAFNANLQEFSQKVSYICAFQTNGKITSEKAYQDLQNLWQQLEQSYHSMMISPVNK